jgi:heterodisulfide reductase subunit A
MTEKIGVYVCHCGTNISKVVDCKGVAEYAKTLPNVVVARDYQYTCSDPGQDMIKKDIREMGLTKVVVASCSPLMHELTFRKTVHDAGLNPFLFQMANIREQCSWITDNKDLATARAKAIIKAAVSRVGFSGSSYTPSSAKSEASAAASRHSHARHTARTARAALAHIIDGQ